MVQKLKKLYFWNGPERAAFIPLSEYVDHLTKFMLRPALAGGVDRKLFQELLVAIERLIVAIFGASTFFLLLLEAVVSYALGTVQSFSMVCTSLAAIAGATLIFAGVSFHGRWFHQFYSIFYIIAFLILSHATETGANSEDPLLLYIALSLSQALRTGRFPGLPVILFLALHWAWVSCDGAIAFSDTDFRGVFTFAWAALFALFLETVLFFAANRYLELLALRRQEDADLRLASRVHESLFPNFTENEYLRFHVYRSPENHTGGDFYDLLPMREGSLGVFFGDVAGHGISSAMMSAAMKVVLATMPYRLRLQPAQLLDHLDDTVAREYESHHASGIYMCFDLPNKAIRFANAGHPPLLFAPGGEAFREFETEGSVIGYRICQPIASEHSVPMRSGDRFLLYTDGLTEFKPHGDDPAELSVELIDILDELGKIHGAQNLASEGLLDLILERIQSRPDFDRFRDDVMLALVEIK